MTNETIKIGDIFASNAYSPAFYEVIAKKGKKTIVLRRLENKFAGYAETGMASLVMPLKGEYRDDKTITRRLVDYYKDKYAVEIDNFETACAWDGLPSECEYWR